MTVTPANLTIVADDLVLTYGQTDLNTTYHAVGLVNGDTIASLYDGSNHFYGPNLPVTQNPNTYVPNSFYQSTANVISRPRYALPDGVGRSCDQFV